MSKGWTEERRAAQAERCRKNKPWEQSTGPKTTEGKLRASLNAYKHGGDTRYRQIIIDMLRHNREFQKCARELNKIELIKAFEKQLLRTLPPLKSEKTD